MKTYTLQELQALEQEYLLTLDNEENYEGYDTERGFASAVGGFLYWLTQKEKS